MSNQKTILLLSLLLACLALSHADLYGNPSPPPPPPSPSGPGILAPPPPFRVKGKVFPPESMVCNDPATACFNQTLTCPPQCPQIKPADPKAKGCFIDCDNPTCENGVCLNRKPNCEGSGAGCYDPRFVGGDGVMFYFHGKANRHFALVSDSDLQINARFIGVRPAGRPRDFTWIQALGVRFGPHSFTLSAVPADSWDPTADHLSFSFDGEPLSVDVGHLSSWSSASSGLHVERTDTVNNVIITLPKVFQLMAAVVPVTAEDDRIHGYGVPADDCFAHLEVQFKFFGLSEKVEGVLGQTYRPDFQSPVKRGVPMPVMGGEDKYAASSLLSTDCNRCIFSSEEAAPVVEVSPSTLDCTSKMSSGYAVVCRR
ncbi:uncharacterized protein [Typha angustifolia]|uniref:uncharacterized protein n=1 Tax=Typha angustifolia TaxID=59011 RepID=UPI003C2B4D7B